MWRDRDHPCEVPQLHQVVRHGGDDDEGSPVGEDASELGTVAWREDAHDRVHLAVAQRDLLPGVGHHGRHPGMGHGSASHRSGGDVGRQPLRRCAQQVQHRCQMKPRSGTHLKNALCAVQTTGQQIVHRVEQSAGQHSGAGVKHRGGVGIGTGRTGRHGGISLPGHVNGVAMRADKAGAVRRESLPAALPGTHGAGQPVDDRFQTLNVCDHVSPRWACTATVPCPQHTAVWRQRHP